MFKSGYNIVVAWVAVDDPYIVETRRYLSPLFAGSQFVQPDAIVLEAARSGNTPFAAGQFGRKTGERVRLPLIFDCPVVHQVAFSRTNRKSCTDLGGAPRESKLKRRVASDEEGSPFLSSLVMDSFETQSNSLCHKNAPPKVFSLSNFWGALH